MKVHDEITAELKEWASAQPVYFVATSPLDQHGHVNVSPRGLNHLRILDPLNVVLLDLVGSGNETAAHIHENKRITIMFCAFEGPPRILRFYGEAEVILPDQQNWASLRAEFDDAIAGVRQIFNIRIKRVQTSCGFGVPLMDFVSDRDALTRWAKNKDTETLETYQQKNNRVSIDGLDAPFTK